MNRVIVSGANGFIGSSLIKKLIVNNVEVIAIDISFSKSRLPESSLITSIEFSFDDMNKIQEMLPEGQYDAFYHFAWRGVNGPDKADPVIQLDNIQMAMKCAMLAKKLNCKKFLCAGTVAEQATHSLNNLVSTSGGMMYGVAKYCAALMLETYCKNIGQDYIWMQFSNIYGPENRTGNLISYTIAQLKKGEEATFGPALQPYDFIYVEDLIEAICRLGDRQTKKNFYFIGSGQPHILKDYLFEVGKLYGREDLIKIGVRPDDGIEYQMEMFDTSALVNDIGEYITMDFTEAIKYTLDNF